MLKTLPKLLEMAAVNVRTLTAAQAKQEIAKLDAIFIDVRERAEFADKATKGTVNIPRGILEGQILNRVKDEEYPIYLHCAAGFRATLAAESIQRLGYKNVTVISCKFADIDKVFSS